MSVITANGDAVYDAQICRPRIGAWHADLRVVSDTPLSGPVTLVINDGSQTLIGTALRSQQFLDVNQVRVVGGAGGLSLSAMPKHYNATSFGIVLNDLLRAVGEVSSVTSDVSIMTTPVATWTTTGLPVGELIGKLIAAVSPGAAWRVLPDGTVWVGNETWPESTLDPSDYQIMDAAGEEGSMSVNVNFPSLEPGTTFEGRRVSYVQTDVPHIDSISMRVWFEDATTSSRGRLLGAFEALVRSTPFAIDYRASYWGTVIAQAGSTIDVRLDKAGAPGMGGVRLVNPAGMTATGIVGGRVLVSWTGGNPSGAYATLFDGGEAVGKRVINGTSVVLGGETGAQAAVLGDLLNLLLIAIQTHTHAVSGALASPSPQLVAGQWDVRAANVRVR